MDEKTLRARMIECGLTIKAGPVSERLQAMEHVLKWILPPRGVSDRTCQRNVMAWLRGSGDGHGPRLDVLARVIDAALEATGKTVRNPPAVFMKILKSELGYRPPSAGRRDLPA
jgi:hypothetical protein